MSVFGHWHPPHHGLDVKRAGLAATVLLARLYAVAGASPARPTPDRLAAAARGGLLRESGARQLDQAYRTLSDVRLDAQLRASRRGEKPGNIVAVAELDAQTRHYLGEAFGVVRAAQLTTAQRYPIEAIS
jgi:signal-transduction protein with cAMP-binding, CBS, and nucleotidyltransferase domain